MHIIFQVRWLLEFPNLNESWNGLKNFSKIFIMKFHTNLLNILDVPQGCKHIQQDCSLVIMYYKYCQNSICW
jgi:hypothetical protein